MYEAERKCNLASADYLGLSRVLEVLLIEVSLDIVGLKAASITLLEFLMQLLLRLCAR